MSLEKMKSYGGAFVVGGVLGVVGQCLFDLTMVLKIPMPYAIFVTVFAIAVLGCVLWAAGFYSKLDRLGAMGAAIPMSGLSSGLAGILAEQRAAGVPVGKAVMNTMTLPGKIFGVAVPLAFVLALAFRFLR